MPANKSIVHLDCTLRDGGYYNNWDFPDAVVQSYIASMEALGVGYIELGFRFTPKKGFLGACAYTPDEYINRFRRHRNTRIAVMLNAADYLDDGEVNHELLNQAFPNNAGISPVALVRVACHYSEFAKSLPISNWLHGKGFSVGFNIMQIGGRSAEEILEAAKLVKSYPVDVLYFADSLGNLDASRTRLIVKAIRDGWNGDIGIHTHDNMGNAIVNTLAAIEEGVTWVDSTVTGMGRGPGNAQTELLSIALRNHVKTTGDIIPLLQIIDSWFGPAKAKYGWGTNPYYYLAGAYGIHPSYVQQMLDDDRFEEEDIIAVIEYLKHSSPHSYSEKRLDLARRFYYGDPKGSWSPKVVLDGKRVLLLGSGPSVRIHKRSLEDYIRKHRPVVVAMNLKEDIDGSLIDLRVACHPVRLLSDSRRYASVQQPLVYPKSMLPSDVVESISAREVCDFGIGIEQDKFIFAPTFGVVPSPLVLAYALAMINSGNASLIELAGFDGYAPGDSRHRESQNIFDVYLSTTNAVRLESLTPTRYTIPSRSIYEPSR